MRKRNIINNLFNKVLEKVKLELKDYDSTNGNQLNNFLKKYFNDEYIGITINNNIPNLKNNQFVINNKDNHWNVIYKLNDELYEFDSYGRNLLGSGYKDIILKNKNLQGYNNIDNSDCGQRSLTYILLKFKPLDFIYKFLNNY